MSERDRHGPRGTRLLPAVLAATGLGILGVLGYIAVTTLSSSVHPGGTTSSRPAPSPVAFHPSATDPAQAAQQTAQAFLDAWQSGDDGAAAALTDSRTAAATALKAYRSGLHLSRLVSAIQNSTAAGTVSFSVTATVGLPADSATNTPASTGTWTYTSRLAAEAASDGWLVRWKPDLLAPDLTPDTYPATLSVPPGAAAVTDAASNNLAGSADPGLRTIAGLLAGRLPSGKGAAGLEVAIVDAAGKPMPGSVPDVLIPPVAGGTLATTIDPKAESAAMKAVGMFPRSALVVLQPSTGKILAIANNDGFNDDALTARIAPGSTMKVVTSAALLNQGLTTQSAVACPVQFTVTGVTFHNSGNESRPAGTAFLDDFAASCNNAFTTQYGQLGGGRLADTARTYFGLNQAWDIGLGQPAPYFTMPAGSENSELAAEAFGQGTIGASPIAMASIAATVDTGVFHQPYLVPGAPAVKATTLPQSTDSALRAMMRAVVSYPDGTAHGVGFGPGVYAKTGTADHGTPNATPNSWMIAFDPRKDLAIGCVVLGGAFGAQSAGPEAASVLAAL